MDRYWFIVVSYQFDNGSGKMNLGRRSVNTTPANKEILEQAGEGLSELKGLHSIMVESFTEFKNKKDYDAFWGL